MKWDIGIVMAVGSGCLLHLRLRAGAASQVGITSDRGEGGRASSEVVVRNAIGTVVGIPVAVVRAVATRGAVMTTRLEGSTG